MVQKGRQPHEDGDNVSPIAFLKCYFLSPVLDFILVRNNVYVPASLLALLYCSNAYSCLYSKSSIAAKLCLHISISK